MIDGSPDAVLRALERSGFDLGLSERLRLLTLLAELVARGVRLEDRQALSGYLTPLLGREPTDARRVAAALSGLDRPDAPQGREDKTPTLPPRFAGRRSFARLWGRVGVILAVAALALFAWRVLPSVLKSFAAGPPPSVGDRQALAQGPPVDAPAPRGKSLEGVKAPLQQTVRAFSGAPTLTELWNTGVFDEPPAIVAARTGLAANQPLPLNDAKTVSKLLHAIAPADDATTSRVAAEVAATPPADPREARLASGLTPAQGQGEVIATALKGMSKRPWSTRELATWAASVAPQSQGLAPARVARLVAARAAVAGQVLQLTDAPWAQASAGSAARTPTPILRRAAPLLAALAGALVGVLGWIVVALRLRGAFERRRPLRPVRLIELILARRPDPPSSGLRQMAERLGRPRSLGTQVDLTATAARTASNGGLFTLVERPRLRAPEYLFLIDRRARADHLAQQLGRMMQQLAHEKLDVRWLFFERQPDRARPAPGAAALSLAKIASRDSNRQLVVVGDAVELSSSVIDHGSRWRALIAQWGNALFLSTGAAQPTERVEQRISRRLQARLAPLSADLLQRLAAHASGATEADPIAQTPADGPAPIWLKTEPETWTSERPPSADQLAALDQDLRRTLGYHGLRWLQACAVYPQLHWRLTEAIGATLLDHAGSPIASPERALRLYRLPWMRLGEMPEWLRIRLIDRMEADDAAAVRTRLAELLDQAALGDDADAGALAVSLEGGDHPYADRTFASFVLRGRADRRAPSLEAGRRLRRVLDISLERRLMQPRALAWLAVGAAAAIAAAYGVNGLNGRPIGLPVLVAMALLAVLGGLGLIGVFAAVLLWLRQSVVPLRSPLGVRAPGGAGRTGRSPAEATSLLGRMRALPVAIGGAVWRPGDPRSRLVFLMVCGVLSFVVLVGRTASLALSGAPHSSVEAGDAPSGARAALADRNGVILAVDVPTWTVMIDSRKVPDPMAARAALLSVDHSLTPSRIDRALKRKGATLLQRNASAAEVTALRPIPGLSFIEGRQRDHPEGAAAAQLVGLTDVDGHGLSGAERGLDGMIRAEAAKGAPIRLSIDLATQRALDAALRDGMVQSRSVAAAGVVLDPATGQILAMTSLPVFDPKMRKSLSSEALTNRAASSLYEFGALWAPFTEAAGLSGAAGGAPTARPAPLSPATLARTLKALGLLDRSPVQLSEARAPLTPKVWTDKVVAAVRSGHGVAVSALNMATAQGVLINQGRYVAPTLRLEAAPAAGTPVFTSEVLRALGPVTGSRIDLDKWDRATVSAKPLNGAYSPTDKIAAALGWLRPPGRPDAVDAVMILFDRPQRPSADVATRAFDQLNQQIGRTNQQTARQR